MSEIFQWEGRYNRARYFWTSFSISICAGILSYILESILIGSSTDSYTISSMSSMISLIINLLSVILLAFQIIKRLHDLNRPGTHYWMLLIPLYNIYLSLVLLFQKGTEGPNMYGPDPLAVGFGAGYAR